MARVQEQNPSSQQRPIKPIKVGMAGLGIGGGMILSAAERMPEVEIFAAADVRKSALDAFQTRYEGHVYDNVKALCEDPDVEVIWVGTQGLDLDKDGNFEVEEAGLVAGFADMDGNGDPEIVIADKARTLGDYFVGGFGFDKENTDRFEVIWIGMLNDEQRAAVGAIVSMTDIDSDGDDEVLVQDLSRSPKENFLDVDRDGDIDITIGSQT